MKNPLNGFGSRLLRPVIISVLVISIVQVVITLWVSQNSVTTLVEQVVQTLNQGGNELAARLDKSGEGVKLTMEQLSENVAKSLGDTLTQQLSQEQQQVSQELIKSTHQSAHAMAELMALVAPNAIWDRDGPELTRLVRDLQRNPQVIFAAYLDADGKPLTRYLDRGSDKVKALLASGQGRRSLDKVMDAAKADTTIYLIETDINPKGAVIGRFVMATSEQQAQDAAAALDQRFEKLIQTSLNQVQSTIASEAQQAQQTLQQSLQQAAELNRSTGESTKAVVDSASGALMRSIALVLVALGVLLVLALAVIMAIRITSKINTLTLALNDLAEGEGDLTQRIAIDSHDEIADMATAVNLFVEKTQRLVSQANSAADETGMHIEAMHSVTDQANQAVDRQHQQLNQVSSAMSEMVASVQQVAERIQENLANVDSIRQASGEASQISASVRSGIETLVEQVGRASEVVNDVAGQSQQIEVVLDVIKSIAEQTNLLALNAAIEAARAGESGRGFAVVADEVRALAGKTQQSTEDIQQRIDGLQREVKEAVNVIQGVCGYAESSIEEIGRSDERMQSVSGSVGRLYDLTNDIAAMAEQQSQVSADVNGSIEQISQEAELAAGSMQQNAQASNALGALAQSLKGILGQFKV
ncbi:MAG: methyl-accepting chemotaxis protein [Halopseudomonas sp.]